MSKSHGQRKRSRSKYRLRRKMPPLTVTRLLARFGIGEKVVIRPHPSVPEKPHPRFTGKLATVVGKQGKAYVVKFRDGRKEKKLVLPPVHLRRLT